MSNSAEHLKTLPPEQTVKTVQDKLALLRLANELRGATFGPAVVGLIEMRNLLSLLFPEFNNVRDEELDNALKAYVEQFSKKTLDNGPQTYT